MRAIAPSTPPHVCLRQGRQRLTPRFCAAGEVIDFALVAVYGLDSGYVGRMVGRAGTTRASTPSMPPHVCPRQGRLRPTPRFFAAGDVIDFALVTVYGLNNCQLFCLPPVGPLEAHAEVLCRRRRRRSCDSNMRRRWCARREAIGQVHRREG
jgi:hypothetical protein